MLTFKRGDILTDDAEALVNTVNCVGIMGRGIALQFKKAFPENFAAYAAACQRGDVQPGHLFVFETNQLTNPRLIINFPTKRHWRGKSRLEDIEAGLKALATEIQQQRIQSIAIPPLGSGLGGLDWDEVRTRIDNALHDLDSVDITVYEPSQSPNAPESHRSREVPRMTAGRAALVGLIYRYQSGMLDPFITLLEAHKLMYFLQEAGQPLRLRYVKGTYGPYAENLRHVLNAVEGHLISGYADGGDSPQKPLSLVPGAIGDATAYLKADPELRSQFDRVAGLVEGFETPYGLELLSSVHWVATQGGATTEDAIVDQVYRWGPRKKRFTPDQIRLAVSVLQEGEWIGNVTQR